MITGDGIPSQRTSTADQTGAVINTNGAGSGQVLGNAHPTLIGWPETASWPAEAVRLLRVSLPLPTCRRDEDGPKRLPL